MASGAAWLAASVRNRSGRRYRCLDLDLASDYFYDSVQIVNWYHAVEHLSTAAEAAYPDALTARHRWLAAHKMILFQGEAEQVGQHLRLLADPVPTSAQETLQQEAAYFEKHKHRM